MKKIILMMIIILLINYGCKKDTYNRLLGKHELIMYSVNGIDSLQQYKDSLGTNFYFFYDEINHFNVVHINGYSEIYDDRLIIWHWALSDDNKKLVVNEDYSITIGIGPFGKNKTSIWGIKWTNKEIELKTTYNNRNYIVQLINK